MYIKGTAIKLLSVMAVAFVFLSGVALTSGSEGEGAEQYVLFDKGEGTTYWVPADTSNSNVESMIAAAATSAGLTYSRSGADVTIDGVTTVTVGAQTIGWRYYEYVSNAWVDKTATYDGSASVTNSVALGLYPSGTVPTEVPGAKESWTQVRGNASMDKSMVSSFDSATPMEKVFAWSKGTNDYVTGATLVAKGKVYAFYNGGYMNTQAVPSLFCFDRFTGETLWNIEVPPGVGYETQSGCIVGDYYYLPTTYGYIYKVPLAGPGDTSYYVSISSNTMTKIVDGKKVPAVTSVKYKLESESIYTDAILEDMDVDAYDIPVTVGSKYDIQITDGVNTYNGTMTVSTTDALGVKVEGKTDADKTLVKDFSSRVTFSYSNVDKVFISKIKSPDLEGRDIYSTAAASLTYWGGAIFFGTSAGYTYALDYDLNVLWKTDLKGQNYYDSVMVKDNRAFVGTYSCKLYSLNVADGSIVAMAMIDPFLSVTYGDGGRVCTPVMVGENLIFSTSDGLGMNSTQGGFAIYKYSGDAFTKVYDNREYGQGSTYMTAVSNDNFKGAYFVTNEGITRLSTDGVLQFVNQEIGGIRASPTLVNGDHLIMHEYAYNKNGKGGHVYYVDLDGVVEGEFLRPSEIDQWAMSPVIVVGNYIYAGTDNGFFIAKGEMPAPSSDKGPGGMNPAIIGIIIVIALIAVFVIVCFILARKKGVSLGSFMGTLFSQISGFHNDAMSKTKANKHRLVFVLVIGLIMMFIMFMCCLAYGPSMSLSPLDALSNMFSAVKKGGNELSLSELVVFESRLPRAIAAIGVGVGLAVAGCIYQAVIRNPMVDPYIMGVSSGAGTFAVAAIASGFTLFGLLSNSTYSVPILAILGGLFAFGLTMLIAAKAGNSATSYVLAGVVIGLAFSSIQTVILTTSDSDKLHSAISWLYGSFTSVDWSVVWIILFPSLFISLAFLFWAKELNLILLGDDNAQQMGLNVRRFDTIMLIMASVLTSVCVAFVGIIGFVGLVVPHVCRMILGGDHRLVLPASMVLGGALMLLADLLARMIMIPLELPVGAITTVVGVPVFAYLLIKKGRIYNG